MIFRFKMTYGIRERTLYDPLSSRLREIGYTCVINPDKRIFFVVVLD